MLGRPVRKRCYVVLFPTLFYKLFEKGNLAFALFSRIQIVSLFLMNFSVKTLETKVF